MEAADLTWRETDTPPSSYSNHVIDDENNFQCYNIPPPPPYSASPYDVYRHQHFSSLCTETGNLTSVTSRDDVISRCDSVDSAVSLTSSATTISQESDSSVQVDLTTQAMTSQVKKRKADEAGALETPLKRQTTYKRNYDKPPYTYAGMIALVIYNSPQKMLSLSEIQTLLMGYFSFFRGSYKGWRDSVRHTLSHMPCFIKKPVLSTGSKHRTYRRFCWTLDLSQIELSMFQRRDVPVPGLYTYEFYLHDELELRPVPTKQSINVKTDDWPMTASTTAPEALQTSARPRYTVRMPHVTPCGISTESPLGFQDRGLHPSSYDVTSPHYNAAFPYLPSYPQSPFDGRMSQFYFPNSQLTSNVCDVMNYIATDQSHQRRFSIDAIDNLSFLCTEPTTYPEVTCKPELVATERTASITTGEIRSPAISCKLEDISDDDDTISLHVDNFRVSPLLHPLSPTTTEHSG